MAPATTHGVVSKPKHYLAQIPQTSIIRHTPGFAIFDNLFVKNGTVYVVSNKPQDVPPVRMMTSPGYPVRHTREETAKWEPTSQDMRVVTSEEASALFGAFVTRIDGVTFIGNDPQFINHYYHFTAELFLGLWRAYSSLDTQITPSGRTTLLLPSHDFPSYTLFQMARLREDFVFVSSFPSTGLEFQKD